jgi:hypothetical protein
MNLLFAADTPWVWDAERNYRILVEENPDLVQAARRGSMAAGDLEDQLRKGSVASQGERRRASLAVRGSSGRVPTMNGGGEKEIREVNGEK